MIAPRVAIVGAGFGGLAAAKALARGEFDVAIIDHNHHPFQSLLCRVATVGFVAVGDRVAHSRHPG